jgi:hypothetical protein
MDEHLSNNLLSYVEEPMLLLVDDLIYSAVRLGDGPYSPRTFLWLTMPLIHQRKYYKHTHQSLNNLVDNAP